MDEHEKTAEALIEKHYLEALDSLDAQIAKLPDGSRPDGWRYAQDQLAKLEKKLEAMKLDFATALRAAAQVKAGHSYPHMCRDGHEEIGFKSDSEVCPVCRVIAQLARDGEGRG